MMGIDDINKLAEIVADVVGLQCGVVGVDGIAVLGTGHYKKNIGTVRPRGCYFYRSMETGESYIIDEPGIKANCKDCEAGQECPYTFVLCSPINSNSEVIGVTGLLGYKRSLNQTEDNNKKYEKMQQYIKKLAIWFSETMLIRDTLCTRKLPETLLKNIFQVDSSSGLVITDPNLNILRMDDFASELLGCNGFKVNFNKNLNDLIPEEYIHKLVYKKANQICCQPYHTSKQIKITIDDASAVGIKSGIAFILQYLSKQTNKLTDTHLKNEACLDRIIGNSLEIREMKQLIKKAALSNLPVLIVGETGTGKELVAEALHSLSARSDAPIIAVNCAAIPETLAEGELFGYEGGAFKGTRKERTVQNRRIKTNRFKCPNCFSYKYST